MSGAEASLCAPKFGPRRATSVCSSRTSPGTLDVAGHCWRYEKPQCNASLFIVAYRCGQDAHSKALRCHRRRCPAAQSERCCFIVPSCCSGRAQAQESPYRRWTCQAANVGARTPRKNASNDTVRRSYHTSSVPTSRPVHSPFSPGFSPHSRPVGQKGSCKGRRTQGEDKGKAEVLEQEEVEKEGHEESEGRQQAGHNSEWCWRKDRQRRD